MDLRSVPMALALGILASGYAGAFADDWPTYRHDARRSGITAEKLPPGLAERWTFTAAHPPSIAWSDPQPKPVEDVLELPRMRFDDAYHVAVADGRVFFGSSADNAVLALDADTGRTLWVFYTDGPVRLAPTVAGGKVYAGSDDGHVYCLSAADGRVLWSFAAAPSPAKVLGSGRMISLWPVRTGVLVEGTTAWFGAGLFPAEGLRLHAVNADDGKVLWTNDSYGRGGLGAISPQGPMLASQERLFVPSGRAMPAAFDRRDGRFLYQAQPNWRKVGLFGGSECALAGDRLCTGTEQLMLSEEANGKLASTIDARRAVLAPDLSVVLTGEEIIAAEAEYWPLRTALKVLPAWRKFTPKPGAAEKALDAADRAAALAALALPGAAPRQIVGDLDGLEKDLTDRQGRALKWRLPCKDAESIVLAGRTAIVGGKGIVRAFDVDAGRQTWLARVNGAARGLAVAGGRLLVSTDAGSIHCFAAGADSPARSVSPTIAADPFGGQGGDLAERLLADCAIRRGYALLLGGDGRLALDLARRSDLMVYLVDSDADRLAAARRALAAAGMYGTRVTVAHWRDVKGAYSDYFANLIVCRGEFLPAPAQEAMAEMHRMLKPCGGTAYLIGLAHAAPVASGVEVEKTEAWTKLTRGPLPGAGSWTHEYADPSNSACGDDQLVDGSLGVLWYGEPGPDRMPSRHSGNVAPLAFDGRMFVEGENFLAAYDAYNGLELWRRDMPGALRLESLSGVSNFAGSPDGLFIAIGESCQRLDPNTGKTRAWYGLPSARDENRHQWVYTACADGLLFGSRDADCLFAMDIKTRKLRWKHDGNSIQLKTICIGDGRVYFADRSVTDAQRAEALVGIDHPRRLDRLGKPIGPDVRLVVCLDAKTGQRIWARPQYVSDCVAVNPAGGDLTAMYARGVLVLCGQPWNGHFWKEFMAGKFSRRSLIALAGEDGRPLWSGHKGYRSRPLIVGDQIIAEPWAHDLKTGNVRMRTHPLTDESSQWQMSRPGHHCGNIVAAPNALFFRSGSLGYYDLATDGGTVHFGAIRPGCWINCIPANGLVMMPEASSGCVCAFPIQCTIVFQPRRGRTAWSTYSAEGATTPVQRLAVNLGAPGDRRDATGRLWLCHPRPRTDRLVLDAKVAVDLPKTGRYFARGERSAAVAGSDYAWIFASGCEGLTRCTIPLAGAFAAPRRYTVRLFFADPANDRPGRRVFDVRLQAKSVLEKFDIAAKAGGADTAVVKEFTGVEAGEKLQIELKPAVGLPLLCAVEVLAEP